MHANLQHRLNEAKISSLLATNYNELMVAPGEGGSPMTSSDAETDFKPIIILLLCCGTVEDAVIGSVVAGCVIATL